jgi:hypothetical protein
MGSVLRFVLLIVAAYVIYTRWEEIDGFLRGVPQNVRAGVQFHGRACDPSYPNVCIPPPPPMLDCSGIRHRNFKVFGADPHGLDPDKNGVACEL